VTPEDAARAWVEAWQDGWARHDPDVIAARYAEGCRFRSEPFRELEHGRAAVRAYAKRSFDEERSARFTFGEPIVAPDGRAAVEYRAVITAEDGTDVTIHGVSLLRVGPDGLIAEHRDTWAELDGDHGIELGTRRDADTDDHGRANQEDAR
jgi:nuclear transport factor 2 (NTF2) superfamily protein